MRRPQFATLGSAELQSLQLHFKLALLNKLYGFKGGAGEFALPLAAAVAAAVALPERLFPPSNIRAKQTRGRTNPNN